MSTLGFVTFGSDSGTTCTACATRMRSQLRISRLISFRTILKGSYGETVIRGGFPSISLVVAFQHHLKHSLSGRIVCESFTGFTIPQCRRLLLRESELTHLGALYPLLLPERRAAPQTPLLRPFSCNPRHQTGGKKMRKLCHTI